jgi:hypothetical protein
MSCASVIGEYSIHCRERQLFTQILFLELLEIWVLLQKAQVGTTYFVYFTRGVWVIILIFNTILVHLLTKVTTIL